MTPAQRTALGNDIATNSNTIGGVAISALPRTSDNAGLVADWYNQLANPAYVVWRDLPMTTILGLIDYAKMTPAQAIPTTNLANEIFIWLAKSLSCQGKQFNLQNLTIGRDTASMKNASYRAALQDCLTAIPAGNTGQPIAANWTGVQDAAKFSATFGEKLFATGAGTLAAPSNLTFEGAVNPGDVRETWGI